MEITGILKVKNEIQVVSDKFQKKEFVITTDFDTQYPQHILLQLVNKKTSLLDQFQIGDMLNVEFNLHGKQWNGENGIKYFNTLDVWKIQLVPKINNNNKNNDNLPF